MNTGDKPLLPFFNAETLCRVWDGALWDVSDQICMMAKAKLAYETEGEDMKLALVAALNPCRLTV